jgi:heat shock protein HslJ
MALALSGCMDDGSHSAPPSGGKPGAPQASTLAGTNWRLVEVQSMDDAQGPTRPADRNLYTMSLAADGSASFRFDCNRGTGSWSSAPSADPNSGSLTFSPLATTKALCPPPSLGERVERDMSFVRSYMLRGGKLNLSLMADGGIYVWEPAEAR